MSKVAEFYSANEIQKAPQHRVYHDNNACPPGWDTTAWERYSGTGNYRLCDDCQRLDREGR
jgi:hypothetical protein